MIKPGQLRRWSVLESAGLQYYTPGNHFLVLECTPGRGGEVGWWCLEDGRREWWTKKDIEAFSTGVSE